MNENLYASDLIDARIVAEWALRLRGDVSVETLAREACRIDPTLSDSPLAIEKLCELLELDGPLWKTLSEWRSSLEGAAWETTFTPRIFVREHRSGRFTVGGDWQAEYRLTTSSGDHNEALGRAAVEFGRRIDTIQELVGHRTPAITQAVDLDGRTTLAAARSAKLAAALDNGWETAVAELDRAGQLRAALRDVVITYRTLSDLVAELFTDPQP